MLKASYQILADWNSNGLYNHAYSDISADVLRFSWRAGRSSDTDYDSASVLQITLDNSASKYSNLNAASPLYGLIQPNTKIKLTMTYGTSVTQCVCEIESITPFTNEHLAISTAELAAEGIMASWTTKTVEIDTQSTALSGAMFSAILAAGGYSGSSSVDSGLSTLNEFYLEADTGMIDSMRQVQDIEFGRIRESKTGTPVFEDRSHIFEAPHATAQSTYGTGALNLWKLRLIDSLGQIYNSYRGQCKTRDHTDDITLVTVSDVARGQGGTPIIIPGSSSQDIWVSIPEDSSYKGVYQWSTVDLEANTASDGSGTDITSSLGTPTKTAYGSQLKISITNSNASNAHLVVLRAHGIAIVEGDPLPIKSDDATSQTGYGRREYPHPSRWLVNPADAQSLADYAVTRCKDPRIRLQFEVRANYDAAHMAEVRDREIGDRIHVTAGEVFGLYIDHDFIIDSLSHTVDEALVHTMTVTCTQAPTAQLGALSNAYTALTIPDISVKAKHPPANLRAVKYPMGLEVCMNAYAMEYNDGIFAAQIRYQVFAPGYSTESVDLSGTIVSSPTVGVVEADMSAASGGANYNVTLTAQGRVYFAFRLQNQDGWSLWTDGNPNPTRVVDYVDTEDPSLADDAPPSDWTITVEAGSAANTARVRASRPSTKCRRLLFTQYQLWLKATGQYLAIDSTTSPATVYYDGSAIAHTISEGGKRIARNSGSGFGTAVVGKKLLLEKREGEFNHKYCKWYEISKFQGDDPTTATWLEISVPVGWRDGETDVRLKIVEAPQGWSAAGFLGGIAGAGSAVGEYYQIINSDGSCGDMTTQEFVSQDINIGDAAIGDIAGRVWFETGYSRSDDEKYSTNTATDSDAIVVTPEVSSPGNPYEIDARTVTNKWLKLIFSADAFIANPTNPVDMQEFHFLLRNTASSAITVTLDDGFQNGMLIPAHSNSDSPETFGVDILEEVDGTPVINLPANTQALFEFIYEATAQKFMVRQMTYNYAVAAAFPAAWAYWKLDEESGTRLDSSSNARHLTPQGTTLPDSAAGVLGDQAHFAGSNLVQNRLELSECWNPADDKKFTYSFWVKSPAVNGSSYSSFILTSNLSVTIQGAYGFYGTDGLIMAVNTEDPWNLWIGVDPGVYLFPPNTESHVCIVYDGVGLYVYVDTVLEMSATGTHGMTDNMNVVKFGMPDAVGVESWCDEFGIWEVALTSDQIARLYNSGAGWSPY